MAHHTDLPEFSRRIQARRAAAGLTTEQLANLTDGLVSLSSLQKYLTGKRKPSARAITAIAKALHCSVSDLNPYASVEYGFEELDRIAEAANSSPWGGPCPIAEKCPANQGLAPLLCQVLARDLTPAQLRALETLSRGILAESE